MHNFTELVSRRRFNSYHGAKRNCFFMWMFYNPMTEGRGNTITKNTITFPPGSTSHRSHCCLQGLERTSKQAVVFFAFLSRALQPLEPPFLSRSPAPHIPSAMFHEKRQAGHKKLPLFHLVWAVTLDLSTSSWCLRTSRGQGEGAVNQDEESQSLR